MSQSRTAAGCIMAAREALTLFNDDELKRFTRQVLERARTYGDEKGTAAIDKAISEVANEKGQQMAEALQTKVNNKSKFERIAKDIKEKKNDLLDFVARRTKKLAYTIESAQKASRKLLGNAFFGMLDKEEFVYLRDGKNDLEIVRAIDGKENVSPMSRNIAKKFKDYIDFRNGEMVSSNALSVWQLNKDRFLRAIHNQRLLISGGKSALQSIKAFGRYDIAQSKTQWREFIKEHLNIEKTFQDTDAIGLDGKINKAEVDNILNKIFDNITTDNPEIFQLGKGSQQMFFYWKDMESMYTYAQRYGKKDLFANIWADTQSSGNRIGMAQIFGDDPVKMYNNLAKVENEYNPVSKFQAFNTKNAFKQLAGIDQSAVSPTLATIGSSVRALTSMKSLGKIAMLSLPDISNTIAFAKRWGFDYWEAYTKTMTGLFNAMPNEERQYLAGVFKEMTDQHLGYVSRMIDANNLPQILNNASTWFFRGVGLEAIDNGNKLSSIYLLSKSLGRMSSTAWEGLPELTRKQMDKFDFGKREWDLLRGKNHKGLFTVDNVEKLNDSEIRQAFGATVDQPLYLIKSDLYRKVYSMFDVWAENAILSPGAYMRSLTLGGTRAGTISGEAMRLFMQFKSYPMQFIDRVLYQGFKDADSAQAKMGYMVSLMGATVPMSFLSYWLNNIAAGRSMPSWDAMNFNEKKKYAAEILFPSFGFLTGFFDSDRLNSDLISNMINTPSTRVLSNAMAAPLALAGGDVDAFTKAMKKFGQGIMPGMSIPFLEPYFKQMLGEKAYLQPGQTQLYGAQ